MDGGQRVANHEKTGGAVAALKSEFFEKRLLDGRIFQPLHRGDLFSNRLHRQHQAGFDRPPVYQNRTRPAVPVFTARLRSRQSQLTTQRFQQDIGGRYDHIFKFIVYVQLNDAFFFQTVHLMRPSLCPEY
ncbi:hypothetical protein SDC9_68244 [bioreactor metagenome]|uniref:Uncharacterized protein n=1 Tax=bioreactor metagenome TaxID=1076179 RepID=A0A644Y6I6_9ZZZZ